MRHGFRFLLVVLTLLACAPAFANITLTLGAREQLPDGSYRYPGEIVNTGGDAITIESDAFLVPVGINPISVFDALITLPLTFDPGQRYATNELFNFIVPAGNPGGTGHYILVGDAGALAGAEFAIPQGPDLPASEPGILALIASGLLVGTAIKRIHASNRITHV